MGSNRSTRFNDFDLSASLLQHLTRNAGPHGLAQIQQAAGQCPHSLRGRASPFDHQDTSIAVDNDSSHGHPAAPADTRG